MRVVTLASRSRSAHLKWPHLIAPATLVCSIAWILNLGVRADEAAGTADYLDPGQRVAIWALLLSSMLATGVATWAWFAGGNYSKRRYAGAYGAAVALGVALTAVFFAVA